MQWRGGGDPPDPCVECPQGCGSPADPQVEGQMEGPFCLLSHNVRCVLFFYLFVLTTENACLCLCVCVCVFVLFWCVCVFVFVFSVALSGLYKVVFVMASRGGCGVVLFY